MQTVRAADTNEVVKLIFRESDNDRKVSTAGHRWVAAQVRTRQLGTAQHKALVAGHAAAGEEAVRLCQPGGVSGQQRHGSECPGLTHGVGLLRPCPCLC